MSEKICTECGGKYELNDVGFTWHRCPSRLALRAQLDEARAELASITEINRQHCHDFNVLLRQEAKSSAELDALRSAVEKHNAKLADLFPNWDSMLIPLTPSAAHAASEPTMQALTSESEALGSRLAQRAVRQMRRCTAVNGSTGGWEVKCIDCEFFVPHKHRGAPSYYFGRCCIQLPAWLMDADMIDGLSKTVGKDRGCDLGRAAPSPAKTEGKR